MLKRKLKKLFDNPLNVPPNLDKTIQYLDNYEKNKQSLQNQFQYLQ